MISRLRRWYGRQGAAVKAAYVGAVGVVVAALITALAALSIPLFSGGDAPAEKGGDRSVTGDNNDCIAQGDKSSAC